ncbi:MAG: nucleoside triphosphate pyrophosphohydrolase [Candidatus Binatia bacterium]
MSGRFDELAQLIARLRSSDGCPWDRAQTHESLKTNLLEESYEVLEAIDQGGADRLREELGDLLLQILFHAQIAAEAGEFTIDDVIEKLQEKLVARHPHVFGDLKGEASPRNADEVVARWEKIKQEERRQKGHEGSVLDGVPKTLPALMAAAELQGRAARAGFEWPGIEPVIEKLEEEIRELQEARTAPDQTDAERQVRVEAEFGDVLLALVNLARFLKLSPEEALRKASARFTERFRYIEEQATRSGRKLQEVPLQEMDGWWEEVKKAEKK